ncbi:hypothetical protein [Paratractidigestivibacter sp.]|uniref:hypothetical protein n=1 Tax=Paratractidigestivibacter sp. TaxID=2847316 RepID=UPI002ABE45AF|nr:hypothetical protein [Paratractidigestivibacter sp.]
MLQRDYILELISQFAEAVKESLHRAKKDLDPEACQEVEHQIGDLLELDYTTALSLAPDSLVTMMVLSGIGDSVASYVCYSLTQLAGVYKQRGDEDLSHIRLAQAKAVAESFGCDPDVVPEEFADEA